MKCKDCGITIDIENVPVYKTNRGNYKKSRPSGRCKECHIAYIRKRLPRRGYGWGRSISEWPNCFFCGKKSTAYLHDLLRIETVNLATKKSASRFVASLSPIPCCEDCWEGDTNIPTIKELHPEIWMRQDKLF